jgi:putative transposase
VREVAALRRAVAVTKAERPFGIEAWVVLPDHLRCVWQMPVGDGDFSTRWKKIKTRFTKAVGLTGPRSLSKVSKGEAGLRQRRFWEHHIRDDADHLAHLRYCWWNPVKHGFVERPVDWELSSVHREVRCGRIEPEWAGGDVAGEFGE